MLNEKFHGDWENLDFLQSFWNPIYDERDVFQYRRTADVWRLRQSGKTFEGISKELRIDERKACALVSGKNLHPYLVQLYLNSEMLPRPRDGWKWVLECTPKPTNAFPKTVSIPERIQSYQDIFDFLKEYPRAPQDHRAIKFFELSSKWVEQHRSELFGFLLGFLVGDAGKYYPEYESRSRHYDKTTMTNMMAIKASNIRILTYVQLALLTIGIPSERRPSNQAIRWNSTASNLLTWIIRVCLGLSATERTSRNPVTMDWLLLCPRNFIIAFIQGLAESDGSVNKYGYYTEIASNPNSKFYQRILSSIGTPSRTHPKPRPIQLRINLKPAAELPLFNPIIASYRFRKLLSHATRRNLLPPPLFSE